MHIDDEDDELGNPKDKHRSIKHESVLELTRRVNGLPPLRSGERKCLRCNRMFKSENLRQFWMCEVCRERE